MQNNLLSLPSRLLQVSLFLLSTLFIHCASPILEPTSNQAELLATDSPIEILHTDVTFKPATTMDSSHKQESSYCDIYLIRHGETTWNIQGKLQGHTDIPLNEEGEQQAFLLKEKLASIQFSAAFSSDLARAKKTAQIVLGSKTTNLVATPLLRERAMGSWEGRLITDLKDWFEKNHIVTDQLPKEAYLAYKWQEDIESYAEVYNRIRELIQSQASAHLGSAILLSSHGGVLRAVLYALDFRPGLRWQVSNCAYIRLRINQAGEINLLGYEGAKLTQHASIGF